MYSIKIKTVLGELTILSTQNGVSRVLQDEYNDSFESGDPFGAAQQIHEYLAGTKRQFDLPVDIKGTGFQTKVWHAASRIAYGKTVTYKDLALLIENPKASRAVGAALSKNPIPIIIPCHRIVGSAGLTGYALGLDRKRFLLDMEKSNLEE